MATLMDTVRIEAPKRSPVSRVSPLGVLVRVPLRDITSSHGVPRRGPIVADALSKMSRLRNATTVSPP